MTTCHDPRHETPCPNAENCVACMEECCTDYWREEDGSAWGAVGLMVTRRTTRGMER